MLIEIATYFQDLWSMWSQAFSVIPYGDPYFAVASPLILMVFAVSEIVSRQSFLTLKRTFHGIHNDR